MWISLFCESFEAYGDFEWPGVLPSWFDRPVLVSLYAPILNKNEELFRTVAGELGLDPVVVEKDYWIMHCLWGLCQQQFSFEMKGGTSLSKGWCYIERSECAFEPAYPAVSDNLSHSKSSFIQTRIGSRLNTRSYELR